MMKIVLSRKLLHLAAESGAAQGMKKYVESMFSVQYPDRVLHLSATASVNAIPEFTVTIPSYEIEWVD